MTEPQQFDSIYEKNGHLYGKRQGQDYPLFIFQPAITFTDIPCGSSWADYLQTYVLSYVPMPQVNSLPPDPDNKFNTQTRTTGSYQYTQQTFCGLPLYYLNATPQPSVNAPQRPILFEFATTSSKKSTAHPGSQLDSGDGDGDPIKFLGP